MNNALKASELILNPDVSIYHLNLLPEDIAPTIFLVGDQNRVPEISKHFDFIELKKSNPILSLTHDKQRFNKTRI